MNAFCSLLLVYPRHLKRRVCLMAQKTFSEFQQLPDLNVNGNKNHGRYFKIWFREFYLKYKDPIKFEQL